MTLLRECMIEYDTKGNLRGIISHVTKHHTMKVCNMCGVKDPCTPPHMVEDGGHLHSSHLHFISSIVQETV
jgi:hypothetical protein